MAAISNMMRGVMALAALILCCVNLHAAELYQQTELFTEPAKQSEMIGVAPKGAVSVLKRKGFWIKVKAGKTLAGWTKLSHVKMKEQIKWMAPIDTLHDTGRMSSGR